MTWMNHLSARGGLAAGLLVVLALAFVLGMGLPQKGPKGDDRLPALELPPAGRSLSEVEWEQIAGLGADLPDRLPVYRVVEGAAGEEAARALADRFGLRAPVRCRDGVCMVTEGEHGEYRLWLNRDGTFSYVTEGRWPEAVPGVEGPGSDEQVAELADTFLRLRGLLPEDFSLWRVEASTAARGDDLEPRVVGKTVLYRRTVGGLPVYGVSRINVDVAVWHGRPQVVAVSSYWHPVRLHETLPLRPLPEALADLQAGRGAIDMPEGAGRARVERVSLAYWEDPKPERQPYLQPVYHFEGTAWGSDRAEPFVASLPALDPAVTYLPGEDTSGSERVPPPLVPEAPAASALVRGPEGDVSLGAASAGGFPAALRQALSVAVAHNLSYVSRPDLFEASIEVNIEHSRYTLDLTYAEPVRLAVALDSTPRRLERDRAGRTIIELDRLLVGACGEYLLVGCVLHGPEGYAVRFSVPYSSGACQGLDRLAGF